MGIQEENLIGALYNEVIEAAQTEADKVTEELHAIKGVREALTNAYLQGAAFALGKAKEITTLLSSGVESKLVTVASKAAPSNVSRDWQANNHEIEDRYND